MQAGLPWEHLNDGHPLNAVSPLIVVGGSDDLLAEDAQFGRGGSIVGGMRCFLQNLLRVVAYVKSHCGGKHQFLLALGT